MKKYNVTYLFISVFFLGLAYTPAMHGMQALKKKLRKIKKSRSSPSSSPSEYHTFTNETGEEVTLKYNPSRDFSSSETKLLKLGKGETSVLELGGDFYFYPVKPIVTDGIRVCLGPGEKCRIKKRTDTDVSKLIFFIHGIVPFDTRYTIEKVSQISIATAPADGGKS